MTISIMKRVSSNIGKKDSNAASKSHGAKTYLPEFKKHSKKQEGLDLKLEDDDRLTHKMKNHVFKVMDTTMKDTRKK